MSFTNIPILDLSLARSPETKLEFLDQLRHALLEVGFLYLKNIGIAEELIDNVVEEGVKFFDIPLEEKYVFSSSASFSCFIFWVCFNRGIRSPN